MEVTGKRGGKKKKDLEEELHSLGKFVFMEIRDIWFEQILLTHYCFERTAEKRSKRSISTIRDIF